MTLERWISLFLVGVFLIYGYTAFLVMDATLPPFAKLSPVWPSSFPKILAVIGLTLSLGELLFWYKGAAPSSDRKNSENFQWWLGISLVALMVAYALLLRPLGFVASTLAFLIIGARLLGESRWWLSAIIALFATLGIWYLVDQVLGIFLRPWPFIVYGGF